MSLAGSRVRLPLADFDALSTVYGKEHAGDETRLLRGEEQRGVGDVPFAIAICWVSALTPAFETL
jgi:hypothetical protein